MANPRQIELVISGVVFGVNIVYNVMEKSEISEDFSYMTRGMRLFQFDYLGGHGTRGYCRTISKDAISQEREFHCIKLKLNW